MVMLLRLCVWCMTGASLLAGGLALVTAVQPMGALAVASLYLGFAGERLHRLRVATELG